MPTPKDEENLRCSREALMNPREAITSDDGWTMWISFDGEVVNKYDGVNFGIMTIGEINAFLTRMEQ